MSCRSCPVMPLDVWKPSIRSATIDQKIDFSSTSVIIIVFLEALGGFNALPV